MMRTGALSTLKLADAKRRIGRAISEQTSANRCRQIAAQPEDERPEQADWMARAVAYEHSARCLLLDAIEALEHERSRTLPRADIEFPDGIPDRDDDPATPPTDEEGDAHEQQVLDDVEANERETEGLRDV